MSHNYSTAAWGDKLLKTQKEKRGEGKEENGSQVAASGRVAFRASATRKGEVMNLSFTGGTRRPSIMSSKSLYRRKEKERSKKEPQDSLSNCDLLIEKRQHEGANQSLLGVGEGLRGRGSHAPIFLEKMEDDEILGVSL